MLEKVLTGSDVNDIACRTRYTAERIRQRVNKAIDQLSQKIKDWELSIRQATELAAIVDQLQAEIDLKNQSIKELTGGSAKFPEEAHPELLHVDTKVAAELRKTLSEIGMPAKIVSRLANHDIVTVLDVARQTQYQLSKVVGLSPASIAVLKKKLLSLGLMFGSDIRLISGVDEYYIFLNNLAKGNFGDYTPISERGIAEDKYREAQKQIKELEKQVASKDRQIKRMKDKSSQLEAIVSQPYKLALEEKKIVIKDLNQELYDAKRTIVEKNKQIVRLEQSNESITEELKAAQDALKSPKAFYNTSLMESDIKCLQLRPKVEKSLVKGGVKTIFQLVTKPRSELLAIEGITRNWLDVIEYKLNPMFLYLEMDVTYDQKTQKYIRR